MTTLYFDELDGNHKNTQWPGRLWRRFFSRFKESNSNRNKRIELTSESDQISQEPKEIDASITPLPRLEMICLCFIGLQESMQNSVLFPFLVFMVESFGYTGPELGLHAGILASSFSAAQFLSSMFWGRLSDKIGLKPCLVLGTLGSAICMLLFGISKSYTHAILARACAGLLNGNLGIVKSFIGKITDSSNRSKGFSLMAVSGG
jgi:MFS family permease